MIVFPLRFRIRSSFKTESHGTSSVPGLKYLLISDSVFNNRIVLEESNCTVVQPFDACYACREAVVENEGGVYSITRNPIQSSCQF